MWPGARGPPPGPFFFFFLRGFLGKNSRAFPGRNKTRNQLLCRLDICAQTSITSHFDLPLLSGFAGVSSSAGGELNEPWRENKKEKKKRSPPHPLPPSSPPPDRPQSGGRKCCFVNEGSGGGHKSNFTGIVPHVLGPEEPRAAAGAPGGRRG